MPISDEARERIRQRRQAEWVKLSPEERSARMRAVSLAKGSDSAETRAKKSSNSRARWESLTPEQRGALSRARWDSLTPEERSANARAAWDRMPPEAQAAHIAASRERLASRSPETKARISAEHRGFKHSPETRARLRAAAAHRQPPSAETRSKQSAALKNRTFSPEHRARLSEANRRRAREHPEQFEAMTRRGLEAMHAATAARAAGTPTSVERRIAAALDSLGIIYQMQQKISWYHVDFVTGALVIEGNGCYWHCCAVCGYNPFPNRRARDAGRYTRLRQRGYAVLVLWEHEINAMTATALAERIAAHLKTSTVV